MPLPCIENGSAPQCQGKSKRTGLPCQNPAAHGCRVCRLHGAHKSRNAPGGANHYAFKHGQATKSFRAEKALASAELHFLRDLGVALGMFGDQPTGWQGRKPKSYQPVGIQSLIKPGMDIDS